MNDAASKTGERSGSRASILRWVLGVSGVATIVWLEYVGAVILQAHQQPEKLSLIADDAMRLVQVRDLLAGQSWFDLTQWRMDPPLGVAMHWSRLIDGPLAALILFFRLFVAPSVAEILAVSVWPVLLLLPAWIAVGRIAMRLADREAGIAALLLAITCVFTLGYFHPGEIDHHNAQIVLTLWTVALLIDSDRSSRAWAVCGVLSALSLAIGLETVPYVVATACVIAAAWTLDSSRYALGARRFGIAFAATALFLTFAVVGARERFSADCLTFSDIYETLAIAGGGGLALLTFVPRLQTSPYRRALAIAGLALVLVAILLAAAPQCSAGPYDWVTPELNRIWLSRIEEARSPLASAHYEIGFFFATYVYAALGVASSAAVVLLTARDRRFAAFVLLLFAAIALAISSLEVRGTPFAVLLGLPCIAAAVRLLARRFMRPGLWRAAAMVVALVLLSNLAFNLFGAYALEGIDHVVRRTATRSQSQKCMGKEAVEALVGLPKGQVAAFIDVPPAILLYTPHSVTAGSYRDADAILDVYRLFVDPPAASAKIIERRRIDYLMTCSTSADYGFYLHEGGANGLLSQLAKGTVPAWLKPLRSAGPGTKVAIYGVLRSHFQNRQPGR